ncbi:hypothetical protein A3G67_03400 [Candidatus Roizmanbacteria bacterium RIFCSPLOWO2_12_FULL_40_12]|uniref:rRNA maturation RNase YbeY n=1 Tax=Candidatus Roizmanbacteria bacterium RIFCSPLOWO2_01_FULL_40_42 TaxID=1802066 RepID=A0A1F7J5J3_9BACT|nr:MAG: hypothetical protein A2779_03035 [Candidatus Roizmanbacteria bacterium RIFCSPHIGHO2_01_FULL_40_98]OGK28316.1 MAG: hypothetical protein A3C31_00400 [Candidatus Roizmanbacteria bacterium RIFCSPHIGHO2_02_FULL_40_53]OGK30552.1 MAG: hypothetical protein A2W49_03085 [Candidatus Roizmanbacteria bacterium RIFCSPHIGHO2_12_41_18]OGK36966.1 MAG: hypothetical protein A3E69_00660 [Candidatus Roizmanbacteria bacterium RIFCSPHIGHO2_12_FULL_40_130]OGK50872.1 MAG: hypothetical protein A3B50_01170 [Candi
MIQIVSTSRYTLNRKQLRTSVANLLLGKGVNLSNSINIVFVGKKKMKRVSATYKKEDVALPVLAFPYKEEIEEKKLLGEIFICYPQAVLLAAQKNKKVDVTILQLIEHGINNLLK